MHRQVFKRRLAKILNEDEGCGMYSRPGIDAQGQPCTHHFALADGMASQMWEGKYRKQFRCELPGWTSLCNPYHVSRMCELALAANRRVPARHPAARGTK